MRFATAIFYFSNNAVNGISFSYNNIGQNPSSASKNKLK